MSTQADQPVRQRRHGAQLETALLTAAWDDLVEIGYGRMTMGSVAARAHTSEPVLYRRWSNKNELVLAALVHYGDVHPVACPDTGTLRGDLIAHLTSVSRTLPGYFAIVTAACFSGLLADAGLTPAQAREQVLAARDQPRVRVVYRRADDRGEINLKHIPPDVLAMPFDLVRNDLLMTLEPLKPKRIRSIVDELFLPLLHHYEEKPATEK